MARQHRWDVNPCPTSAVLVRTPGRSEVGIQCQWLIKGELWGERVEGSREQREDKKDEVSASNQPSRSLLPPGGGGSM